MPLRKKEKVLSPAEIKEKIKKDSASHWMHSEPLFGIYSFPEGPRLLAVSDNAEHEVLLVFLLDAADYVTDRILDALALWKDRYRKLNWKPVLVFQQKYQFLKNAKFYERYKASPVFHTIPIYLDPFGELFEKYGSQKEPVALFLNRGEMAYSTPMMIDFPDKLLEIEAQLHRNLRQQDDGLPLPLLYRYDITAPIDQRQVKASEMTQTGNWIDGRTSLITDDPHAVLSFGFEGKSLRLIATLHPQARENAKIYITLDDQPLNHTLHSPLIHENDKGQSVLEINRNTGIYEILHSNQPIRGIVKFHFHLVIETPVIFYELRQA
jgi:hypothetical protein